MLLDVWENCLPRFSKPLKLHTFTLEFVAFLRVKEIWNDLNRIKLNCSRYGVCLQSLDSGRFMSSNFSTHAAFPLRNILHWGI